MTHTIKFAALALGLASVAAAQAQQGLYVGGSLSRVEVRVDGLSTAKPTALGVRLGNQFSPNLAVEARLGKGITDDTVNGVKVEIDTYYGIYAKGILPMTNLFSAYGLLGYSRGEVTRSGPGGSASDWDSDVSYGLGVDFAITKNTTINVEWARMFKGSIAGANYKVNALSLGANYRF
jgi:opacity protein-like surface antigen